MVAKVFITNDAGLDFRAAEQFGQLVRCTTGKLNVYSPDRVAAEMQRALSVFREGDYLLPVGGALSMIFAGMYLPDHLKRVQLLVYDAKLAVYIVRTITNGETE